jgi:hypothetical protein
MRLFKPIRNCKILASENHHSLKELDYIGRVLKIEGNMLAYTDKDGDTDWIIWNFKEGLNKTICFCT